MNIDESFEKSYSYYTEHEDQLLKEYRGKIIAIYIDKVLGVFSSKKEAYLEVPKKFNIKVGSFLIKECEGSSAGSKQVFHSNVVFGH